MDGRSSVESERPSKRLGRARRPAEAPESSPGARKVSKWLLLALLPLLQALRPAGSVAPVGWAAVSPGELTSGGGASVASATARANDQPSELSAGLFARLLARYANSSAVRASSTGDNSAAHQAAALSLSAPAASEASAASSAAERLGRQLAGTHQESRVVAGRHTEGATDKELTGVAAALAVAAEGRDEDEEQPLDVRIGLTIVYLVIFFIGVIGNACNCLVIADSRNRYMKTATNYYLFSLSVSDLLLLTFGLPHDLVNIWHPSPYLFNQFVCLSRGWISEASTYASVLVIVAFTVERYLAICHPLRAHTLSRLSRSIKIIISIWLIASSCALPVVWQYGVVTVSGPTGKEAPTAQCTLVANSELVFELSVLIFFIIPMAVITILYVRLGCHLRHKTRLMKQNQIKRAPPTSLSSSSCEGRQQQQRRNQHHSSSLRRPTIRRPQRPSASAGQLLVGRPLESLGGQAGAASCDTDSYANANLEHSTATTTNNNAISNNHHNNAYSSGRQECSAGGYSSASSAHADKGSPERLTNLLAASRLYQQRRSAASCVDRLASLEAKGEGERDERDEREADELELELELEEDEERRLHEQHQRQTLNSPEPSSTTLDRQELSERTDGAQTRPLRSSASPSAAATSKQQQQIALHSTVNTANMQSVIKMLVSVVVMFFLCWAPFHAQRLMAVYVTDPTNEQVFIFNLLHHISGISYYISAVVNPILYSLFSVKFRQAFRDTFGSLVCFSASPRALAPA